MAQGGGQIRGFEIPGYRDISQIGRGASSDVFKGFDDQLNRWVAIKVLLTDDPDDPARRRFAREGEITANLGKHPHIVQVFVTGFTATGHPYVAMELCDQGSIADRLQSVGTFTVDDTLDIGEKIADAVAAAHRAGVLHRDIKPQNILLSQYGPALADFGIARAATNLEWSQSLDQLTPMHSPPEVLMGGASTAQSDIYSLGSTLYTMLAGRPPFAGASGESPLKYQVRVLQDPVPPIPRADIPAELIRVLEQTLAKTPGDRQGSSAELRDELRAIQRRSPLPTSPERSATGPDHVISAPVQLASSQLQQPDVGAPTTSRSRPSDPVDQNAFNAPDLRSESPEQQSPRPLQDLAPTDTSDRSALGEDRATSAHLSRLDNVAPQEGPTVSRSRSSSYVADKGVSSPPPNSRRGIWVAAGAVVVCVGLAAGGLILTLSGPERLPVNHVAREIVTGADKPTDVTAIATGTTVNLRWQDPTNGALPYLVIQIDGTTQRATTQLIGRGKDNYSAAHLSPSTSYCFEIHAIIGPRTLGKLADKCIATPA